MVKEGDIHICPESGGVDIYYSKWGQDKKYGGWKREINEEYEEKINFCPFCGEKLPIV